MNYKEEFTKMFSSIENIPDIQIFKSRSNIGETSERILQKRFNRLKKEYGVDYYSSMASSYNILGSICIAWHYTRKDGIVIPGEMNIVDYFNIFFMQAILYDETAPAEEVAHIKELKVFDDHPFLGDGVAATFKIVPSQPEPEIWLFDGTIGGKIFKMDITVEGYFKALLDLRGVLFWQYLFCDVDLNKFWLSRKKENLKNMLETLPKLFPETDYSSYQERFNRLIA